MENEFIQLGDFDVVGFPKLSKFKGPDQSLSDSGSLDRFVCSDERCQLILS
jgi:hypothetical protein